jgi:Nucleotidyl transferase AbiEii toxin, Type IV TA system
MAIKSQLMRISNLLKSEKIPHGLIGGLAVGFSGVARFTNDIDLLIDESDRAHALDVLTRIGYKVWKEGPEFVQLEGNIPLDLMIAKRPVSQQMLRDVRFIPDLDIPCLTTEDLIGLKIQSFATNRKREHRDKADIQALLKVNKVDQRKIKQYADTFDVWNEIILLMEDEK